MKKNLVLLSSLLLAVMILFSSCGIKVDFDSVSWSVSGYTYTKGDTLSSLIATNGFEPDESIMTQFTYSSGEYGSVRGTDSNGNKYDITVINNTDGDLEYKDCAVAGVSAFANNCPDLTINDTVSMSSTGYSTFIDAFGKPDQENDGDSAKALTWLINKDESRDDCSHILVRLDTSTDPESVNKIEISCIDQYK